MIVCPSCYHSNPEGTDACEGCDASLENFVYRVCPSCSALNASDKLFCHHCLTELAPTVAEPTPSRPLTPLIVPVEAHLALPPPADADRTAIPQVPQDATLPEKQEANQDREEDVRIPEEGRASADVEPEDAAEPLAVTEPVPDAELPTELLDPESQAAEAASDQALAPDMAREQTAAEASADGVREEDASIVREDAETSSPSQFEEGPIPEGVEPEADTASAADAIVEIPSEAERTIIATASSPAIDIEGATSDEPEAPDGAATNRVGNALDSGVSPLDGVNDIIPLASSVGLPHRAALDIPREPSEAEHYDAELFRQVAGEPEPLHEQAQVVLAQKAVLLPRVGRFALYLLVLLAALIPLLTGGQTAAWVTPRDSVVAMARMVADLPADAVVLISFDYGPAYAGEMDPLALAVVRHLARHSVRMVVMSTMPGGVGSAERVYRALAGEMPNYQYGQQYAILGFLPGQQFGLRTLSGGLGNAFKSDHVLRQPLGELAATQGLTTVSDFDHVIVISESSESIRGWIEQVEGRNSVALHGLVSSRIEPLLIPYKQSGQLRNLVGAATGAAEYERYGRVQSDALNATDAQAAFFLAVVLAAVATNIVYISNKRVP